MSPGVFMPPEHETFADERLILLFGLGITYMIQKLKYFKDEHLESTRLFLIKSSKKFN